MMRAYLLIFTAVCALNDIKHRSISLRLCIAGALPGILRMLKSALSAFRQDMLFSFFTGSVRTFIPGTMLILLSFLTGGAIGIGDGIFVFICGLYMGAAELSAAVIAAWLLCASASLFLMILKRFYIDLRLRPLPFIAFIFPVIAISSIPGRLS